MISLFIFLSFWLGLSLSYAYLALGIVALAFLFFLFKRFNYRLSLIALAFILAGFAFSFAKTFFLNHRTSVHEGIVYAAKDNYFLINSGGERWHVTKNHLRLKLSISN